MDNLEQFIRSEREQFDRAIPDLQVWANIDAELNQQQEQKQQKRGKRILMWRAMRVAAAVLFLLVSGGVIGSYITQQNQQDPLAVLNEIAPEYMEMERYFQKEVSQKMKRLASYEKQEVVQPDLAQLDNVMEELKQELVNAPKGSEEQILNNLINSYQTKIAILERVLERVESAETPSENKTKENEISI
ncbi:MAG: hypothetical protein AB8G22_02915 [Saprospiraceae bacterium]